MGAFTYFLNTASFELPFKIKFEIGEIYKTFVKAVKIL